MKQLYSMLCASILLIGCQANQQNNTTLSGEIKGIERDTFLLYADDDTGSLMERIPVENGVFKHTFKADSLIQATLVFDHERHQYPVYINKKSHIRITGNVNAPDSLTVTGLPENDLIHRFYASLTPDSIPEKAIAYIKQHPLSPTSIFVIKHFLVNKDSCNAQTVIDLIEGLDGELQDRFSVGVLKRQLEAIVKSGNNKMVQDFTLKDTANVAVTRSDLSRKIVVLCFWASWDDTSRTRLKSLRHLYETYYPPKKQTKNTRKKVEKVDPPFMELLGVSLDVDKKAWLNAIKTDTLPGRQATDLLGWQAPIVQNMAIPTLPYSIVINENNFIIARNIWGEELENLVATRVKAEKEQRDKEKKDKEKREKEMKEREKKAKLTPKATLKKS